MRSDSKIVVSTCNKHGKIEILSDEVSAHTIKFPGSEDDIFEYRFNCPVDDEIIVKNCEPRVHELLRSAGVVIEEIAMPLPESGGDLPPIAESDLASLLTDLQNY